MPFCEFPVNWRVTAFLVREVLHQNCLDEASNSRSIGAKPVLPTEAERGMRSSIADSAVDPGSHELAPISNEGASQIA